jgi:hypothetical protein
MIVSMLDYYGFAVIYSYSCLCSIGPLIGANTVLFLFFGYLYICSDTCILD